MRPPGLGDGKTGASHDASAKAIDLGLYCRVRDRLAELGYGGDYTWSQSLGPPATAEDLACEYTWVVINSGMKNTVARKIMDRVWPQLVAGGQVDFGHDGKRRAIERVWLDRAFFHRRFRAIEPTDVRGILAFCDALPWIGPVTKYHLAKNLGADVAKPDRWLVRLARAEGETVDGLCARLAAASGDRVATTDLVLWRACAVGVLAVEDGRIRSTLSTLELDPPTV